jgi:hypothetical protein
MQPNAILQELAEVGDDLPLSHRERTRLRKVPPPFDGESVAPDESTVPRE